ncbi:lipopolysaccharide core heptose(I) kinase RfaP [Alienimonas californiensis]|uniref:Lipopolysaccharide core heptose(I) kinase RfaP n=1 Tax=Alienimonas californiensis TaxID=2527989 RepID=A0A517P9X8_9PLAN|nr:lipopolysaccharide core heptose(I) kinase RfaP [Alienimonas californiensis]QDT16172.1 Lipopolysaccharide core heptose(I) kinase RfaP [Alienimonas californiensis]
MTPADAPTATTPAPQTIVTERWDDGRLTVNVAFADWLREQNLTTCAAFDRLEPTEVARHVKQRVTARFEFDATVGDPVGGRAFYIKRHGRDPLSEYVKPLFRLTKPVLGARPEWDAMLRFHEVGLPTMTPVAFGETGPVGNRRSFVMTESLEDRERVDHWLADRRDDRTPETTIQRRALVAEVARLARRLHDAGMHHQDLYLCHWLLPAKVTRGAGAPGVPSIIDLGRVRCHATLPDRWRIKDLAQIYYSAGGVPRSDQVRFLRAYLGRPLAAEDRDLVRRVRKKARAIGRHTRRNDL